MRERVAQIVFESFGGFSLLGTKGVVGEIPWKAAHVPQQHKLTRAQFYLDEVTSWTAKNWLLVGLQKQRISVVLHTAIAEQIVN